jgi:hypothetical protein
VKSPVVVALVTVPVTASAKWARECIRMQNMQNLNLALLCILQKALHIFLHVTDSAGLSLTRSTVLMTSFFKLTVFPLSSKCRQYSRFFYSIGNATHISVSIVSQTRGIDFNCPDLESRRSRARHTSLERSRTVTGREKNFTGTVTRRPSSLRKCRST